ncbi:hypothetical protein BJX68DRAFT_190742 [Aspergillus pseudodeflectus]|uniref:Zn(2)-C6 fungal-type domain-containing protein n=1 Tax=Aspergillus pseudodeflectus TaxID=176178 RepID=A0ABR4JJ11_9EURO
MKRIFRTDINFHPRLQKASSACLECRKRKQRCDGASPCYFCGRSGQDCVINEEGDGRRKIALKRKIDSLEQANEILLGLIQTIREADEERALEYFRLIQSNLALEDICQHLLPRDSNNEEPSGTALNRESSLEPQNTRQSRPGGAHGIMDIEYLTSRC